MADILAATVSLAQDLKHDRPVALKVLHPELAASLGAVALPPSKDASSGPYMQHQLARTSLLFGEPDKALDALEPLPKIPYHLTPAWHRIEPTFDPLRSNPRFQRLVAGTP